MQYTDPYTPSQEYSLVGGGCSAQGPKAQCTARIPCLFQAPADLPHLQNHAEPAHRQHSSYYLPLPALPWVCLLLKHNPAPMEMTGSITANPSQQSRGCGSRSPGTPHCQRLSLLHFHEAESFPKMSVASTITGTHQDPRVLHLI